MMISNIISLVVDNNFKGIENNDGNFLFFVLTNFYYYCFYFWFIFVEFYCINKCVCSTFLLSNLAYLVPAITR